ncbi:segregation and condensation protein A [Halobacteriovorax sp. GFR7]|uniref:segregation and condensation protein A n=1 Tax=unclassified Halobacteriovorax TaxID=2639665 RepID=UPI0037178380
MLDTTIKVKTDTFDGPLSLLLLLIQKEQMSIKELNLTKITKQYLDYLANMKELNFDIAGDYLFLAATLVLLKSKNAVTEEEQAKLQNQLGAEGSLNITSHAELVRRLEELALYQKMGQKLLELPQTGKDIFVKPKVNRKEIVNSILTPMELEKLTDTMIDFIFRQNRKYTVIKRDRLSIKEKLEFLKTYLQVGQKTNLEELLENDSNSRMATTTGEDTAKMSADGKNTIDNVVITFISLLELARLKRVQVFQNESFGQVYVDVVKTLDDFDVTQADGFDDENESKDKIDTQELENMEQVAH